MKPAYDLLFESISKWRDLTCISFGRHSFTYAEILAAASGYGDKLSTGVSLEGKIVAIRCSSAVEFMILFLSLIRKGAIVFPVGHDIPINNFKKQLDLVEVDYIVSTLPDDEVLPGYDEEWRLATDKFFKDGASFLSSTKMYSHIDLLQGGGFIRFTSGTTGSAKGVFVSYKSALERIAAINGVFDLTPGECVLNLMPCAYHFIVSLLHFLSSGAHIMIPRSNTISMILELGLLNKTSIIYAAPFHYRILSGLERRSLGSSLRLAISTGDSLDISTADVFYEKFAVQVSQAYGLIEVGLPIVSFLPNSEMIASQLTGRCYPPYQVKVDTDGNDYRDGCSVGRLAINGPGMFDAYLLPLKVRSEVLVDGWFYTGDLASIDEAGGIQILGRNSAVIKFMGHKIYPEEVEKVLNSHPSIVESRVYCVGTPLPSVNKSNLIGDDIRGELIIADIVCDRSMAVSDLELKKYCREYIEKYKIPKVFHQVLEIEKTPTGKMRRFG